MPLFACSAYAFHATLGEFGLHNGLQVQQLSRVRFFKQLDRCLFVLATEDESIQRSIASTSAVPTITMTPLTAKQVSLSLRND